MPRRGRTHETVGAEHPTPGPSPGYGAYLVELATCKVCHGPNLAGQNKSPGPPPAPSLTAYATTWSVEDFQKVIRTGVVPGGRTLNPQLMPWQAFAHMTDDELGAIWSYVRSLPAARPASGQ